MDDIEKTAQILGISTLEVFRAAYKAYYGYEDQGQVHKDFRNYKNKEWKPFYATRYAGRNLRREK